MGSAIQSTLEGRLWEFVTYLLMGEKAELRRSIVAIERPQDISTAFWAHKCCRSRLLEAHRERRQESSRRYLGWSMGSKTAFVVSPQSSEAQRTTTSARKDPIKN